MGRRRGPSKRWIFAAVLGALFTGSTARADMGVPWLNRGVVNYRVTFAGDFPDHTFVVYRHITKRVRKGDPARETDLNADEAEYVLPTAGTIQITHPPATANRVSVLIAPRAAVGSGRAARDLGREVLAGRVPGATWYHLPLTAEWPAWRASRLEIDFQVRPAPGGGPELVRSSWDPLYQCWVVGLLLPAAVVASGWWVVGRRLRGASRRVEPGAGPDRGA